MEQNLGSEHDDLMPATDASVDPTDARNWPPEGLSQIDCGALESGDKERSERRVELTARSRRLPWRGTVAPLNPRKVDLAAWVITPRRLCNSPP